MKKSNDHEIREPDQQIVYKPISETELKLHVFLPPGWRESDRRPAIVFFFGGGWLGGTPTQFFPHCSHLSARGMVAISAEYRVQNVHGTTPQECVKDGKSAMRWVRGHASELGIDPESIAAGGGSAGGHVAAATALVDEFEEEGEATDVSCRPDALVLFNPVFDNGPDGYGHDRVQDYWEAFSPMHNIREATPATIVFFGTEDNHVTVETAERYKQLMEESGCRCDLHLYQGQKHGFFNYANTEQYMKTVAEMDRFLESLGYLKSEQEFYTPEKDRAASDEVVEADDSLPAVLLLGDSISQGYTPIVRELLKGRYYVDRPRANCGDTRAGLEKLGVWVLGRTWDVIHFNWGLHDLCYRHPDSKVYGNRDKEKGTISVPLEEYVGNLETLVKRLMSLAGCLIWANTTVVPPGEAGRVAGDEVRYNQAAARIMKKYGIPTNDLYTLTASFSPEMFVGPGDVHYQEAGLQRIAEQVAASIREHFPQEGV